MHAKRCDTRVTGSALHRDVRALAISEAIQRRARPRTGRALPPTRSALQGEGPSCCGAISRGGTLELAIGTKGSSSSAHDLDRRLDAGQLLGQLRQIGRIGADVAGRLHEPVARVGLQVVVSDVWGRRATRHGVVDGTEDVPGVDLAVTLHVRRLDDVLQCAADLQRNGHGPAADRQAAHERGIIRTPPTGRRAYQRRGRRNAPDPSPTPCTNCRRKAPIAVRRQQVELTLRLTKTGKIDRDQVEPLGQAVPYLSEGEQALRPWARQDDGFAPATPGLGEPDLHAICFPDRQVHRHGSPFGPDIGLARALHATLPGSRASAHRVFVPYLSTSRLVARSTSICSDRLPRGATARSPPSRFPARLRAASRERPPIGSARRAS